MFTRYWIVYSRYGDHSRLNSQHTWGGVGVYDHLVNQRLFTLKMKWEIDTNFKNHEESFLGLDLDLLAILF